MNFRILPMFSATRLARGFRDILGMTGFAFLLCGVAACARGAEPKKADHFELKRITRPSPTLNAPPPSGAVVLLEGGSLDAWVKKKGKDWLAEDGPAKWKQVGGGAIEVVPDTDCIITKRQFGDCKVH